MIHVTLKGLSGTNAYEAIDIYWRDKSSEKNYNIKPSGIVFLFLLGMTFSQKQYLLINWSNT